jgi:hypothetical protein
MPEASFKHSVVLDEPMSAVWERLQHAATWAAIGPVDRVWDSSHSEGGDLVAFKWRTAVGNRPYEGTARTVLSDRPRRMQLALDSGELSGHLTASLTGAGEDRSTIEVTMDIETRGLMGTLFFSAISAAVATGLRGHLENFAARMNDEE